MNQENLASFIWGVADLLRGTLKQSQYGRVILPFTVLRRLECVLEPTRDQVLEQAKAYQDKPAAMRDRILRNEAGLEFYNTSPLRLATVSETHTREDLNDYVRHFSAAAREVFEHFRFEEFLERLEHGDALYPVVQRFAAMDLSPQRLDNFSMGVVFEELIRKFAEASNETAGEHFTPRDVVHLTTSLVFTGQQGRLQRGEIIKIYDPAAGTGGFLSEAQNYIQQISEGVDVSLHGQELNPESYAICKADMLIKGEPVSNIALGNTLSDDQHHGERFDYLLANPPFGVDWKGSQRAVNEEHEQLGFAGRFGPGLPRVNDGALLFLLHLVSKMRQDQSSQWPSRIGIILNGSPLFTGGAGGGESEIRRYLLERDLVEAIVALPTDMFYNTGIATYVWILSSAKPAERKGHVQLINATEHYSKMRKSLGNKRQYLDDEAIRTIVKLYGDYEETEESRIFPLETFGYRRITVERPLRLNFQASEERIARIPEQKPIQKLGEEDQQAILDACRRLDSALYQDREAFTRELDAALQSEGVKLKPNQHKAVLAALSERDPEAPICRDKKGRAEPDPDLRDAENVPLTESVDDYFEREVKPHVPDAWIDTSKKDARDGEVGIVGYEIPFNRYFYKYEPPRPLEEIDADLRECTNRIKRMIEELSA
ncbi:MULTISPECIES: type I restriction-modification system subunit M [unclassified Halorhodospira]|uniref:type I restriction-modification system subunit M n=1 Tax=unclassified Halorhodospira TaxID=2626748 RepID=UPI001EE7B3C3|nr:MULTISPECIES: class I SAM-dependent DNA methyltransferase [unclassified Halorhodospira]MCG5541612.1 type I restriction-modification system subunit M [Halorhodospira sp. M39old]MCG5544675.1 type I restriction-modification system subunit M [Halorhodospira sp. M38]